MIAQGTEDLEEVLSQRLQELPPPHGEGSDASPRGSPRTQSGEMPFLIDFDQRQRVCMLALCISHLHRMPCSSSCCLGR